MAVGALTLDKFSPEFLLLMDTQKRLEDGMEEEALHLFTNAVSQLPTDVVQNIYYQVWVLSDSPPGNARFGQEVMFNRISPPQPNLTLIKAEAIRKALCAYCHQTIADFPNALEKSFICTISQQVMEKPVVTSNGQSYEAKEMEKWHLQGMKNGKWTKMKDPNTGTEVSTTVYPNQALENTIEVCEEYKPKLTNVTVIIENNFQEVTQLRQEKSALMQLCQRMEAHMQRTETLMQQTQAQMQELRAEKQQMREQLREREVQLQEQNLQMANLMERFEREGEELRAQSQRYENALQRSEGALQRSEGALQRSENELQRQRNEFNQHRQAQNQVIQTQQEQNRILNGQFNEARNENARHRQRLTSEEADPMLSFWKTMRSWVFGLDKN